MTRIAKFGTFWELLTEIRELLYRAKYHKEPITIEEMERIYNRLKGLSVREKATA